MNKQELQKSYQGKVVYITGITGFKGSWLAHMLYHLGAKIYGIGLDIDKDSLFYTSKVSEIADVTISDITDQSETGKLKSSLLEANPDYIFHLAAQPIVSEGYKDPLNTFQTNIMGTVLLHEAIKCLDKKISLINVTTDKVYKESSKPLVETDRLQGFDPYSLSKSCSDMISICYREALEANCYISTMRAGNVIGGGDMSDNRIIPDILRATINNKPLQIRCPDSVRPYQHVFDALTAYLIIGVLQTQDINIQSEYNIGPDLSQTMETRELVDKMKQYMDFDCEFGAEGIGKESHYLALNNEKLKNVGWKPVFNTNEKVVKSVAFWYNDFIKGKDMKTVTINQIKEAFSKYE